MKLKPKKKIQLSETADILGKDYEAAAESAKAAEALKSKINARIKLVAHAEGKKDGDKTLIRGKNFAVGYQTIPSYAASLIMAAKELAPDLLKKVTKTITVVDEDAFKKAVDSGEITRKQAAAIVVQTGSQDRLCVQRLNK